jgi:hypothetical protein
MGLNGSDLASNFIGYRRIRPLRSILRSMNILSEWIGNLKLRLLWLTLVAVATLLGHKESVKRLHTVGKVARSAIEYIRRLL